MQALKIFQAHHCRITERKARMCEKEGTGTGIIKAGFLEEEGSQLLPEG